MAMTTLYRSICVILLVGGCARTKPGTHVELVDKAGTKVYVSGAAGPGVNKSLACTTAVNRAVAAIALRFSQQEDDLADEIAEAVGVDDGEAFLHRFASADAKDGAVQDVSFDPIDHLCMATVRWTPPLFVKDAVLAYAQKLKEVELGHQAHSAASEAAQGPAPSDQVAADPSAPLLEAPATTRPPPAAPVTSPQRSPDVTPVTASPAAAACESERRALRKALSKGERALADFQECTRRTRGDEGICHRYNLWVDDAKKNEAKAGVGLSVCINRSLPTGIKAAVRQALPGHAAIVVETTADATRVVWALSPVEQTAYTLHVQSTGEVSHTEPLAANQITWLRQQLGL